MAFRRRRSRYFNAFKGPANNAAENPMHNANSQNDLVLRAGKIPKKNVDQRHGAEHHAQTEPPKNPPVNTNVDMAHKFSPLGI
jgi:hypothetical protein